MAEQPRIWEIEATEVTRSAGGSAANSPHHVEPAPDGAVGRSDPAGYPAELVRTVTLSDGARLRIRPVRAQDESRLGALFARLSPRTVYERFLAPFHRLPDGWLHQFANVDYRGRLALVAEEETSAGPELRGVARYEPSDQPRCAEIAIVIEDAWQGRGLGTLLLDDLLRAAAARGIVRFSADLLADNRRVLRLLWRLGRIQRRFLEQGVLHIEFERPPAVVGRPA